MKVDKLEEFYGNDLINKLGKKATESVEQAIGQMGCEGIHLLYDSGKNFVEDMYKEIGNDGVELTFNAVYNVARVDPVGANLVLMRCLDVYEHTDVEGLEDVAELTIAMAHRANYCSKDLNQIVTSFISQYVEKMSEVGGDKAVKDAFSQAYNVAESTNEAFVAEFLLEAPEIYATEGKAGLEKLSKKYVESFISNEKKKDEFIRYLELAIEEDTFIKFGYNLYKKGEMLDEIWSESDIGNQMYNEFLSCPLHRHVSLKLNEFSKKVDELFPDSPKDLVEGALGDYVQFKLNNSKKKLDNFSKMINRLFPDVPREKKENVLKEYLRNMFMN